MPAPPTGTVTFLFTDIEGSTHQWDSEPEAMRLALYRHDMLIRGAVEQHNGYLYKTTGDGFCAAFHTALDGLRAAYAAQRLLHHEQWANPILIKVRMSLVIAERQRTAIRYRLLETMRQHAASRLIAHDGVDKMKNRHLNWCIALVEEAEAHLTELEQRAWMERLETEHANIRAALGWCETCTTRVDAGLRLAGALWRFWEVRGHFSEGRDHFGRLLRQETAQANTLSRAKALNGAGALADNQGDHEMARQLFEKSRDIFGELGDSLGNSRAIHNLGLVAFHQGQYDTARSLYEMSLTTTRKLEDRWGWPCL